ncbi:MAG TPA: MFS transporter, partial [Verrucomicrobiae bacterium]
AHTFNEMLLARGLMGVSEAFYIPAALALIAEIHSDKTRSRAVGIHQTGIYFGIILGGFSGYVAEEPNLGWRSAFTACGIIGALYAIPLLLFLRRAAVLPSKQIGDSPPAPLKMLTHLFRNTSFLLLVLYFTLPALAGWIVKDWMPAILKQRFNIGQGSAGVSATLYVNIAIIIGGLAGGWLADRWMHRNQRGRILTSALGMALIAPALLGIGLGQSLGIAVAFLILFGLGWGCFDTNNMPILSQITRPEIRATAYGLMNFVSISCGGFADWAFGALRDRSVPLPMIFALFASAAGISIVLVLSIKLRPLKS